MREGDTLVAAKPDRLARSVADLLGIVASLEAKKVGLRILSLGDSEVDTRTPSPRPGLAPGDCVLHFGKRPHFA